MGPDDTVRMELPKLSPGKRFTLPRPVGSADSLLLARLAERDKAGGRTTAIVTADATDAQRLIDEMAFFAPGLRCALFPDWETLPYDTFSPHQDLISERLATLWRIQQRDKDTGADVVLVPATTALYRVAPPASIALGLLMLGAFVMHLKVKDPVRKALPSIGVLAMCGAIAGLAAAAASLGLSPARWKPMAGCMFPARWPWKTVK